MRLSWVWIIVSLLTLTLHGGEEPETTNSVAAVFSRIVLQPVAHNHRKNVCFLTPNVKPEQDWERAIWPRAPHGAEETQSSPSKAGTSLPLEPGALEEERNQQRRRAAPLRSCLKSSVAGENRSDAGNDAEEDFRQLLRRHPSLEKLSQGHRVNKLLQQNIYSGLEK